MPSFKRERFPCVPPRTLSDTLQNLPKAHRHIGMEGRDRHSSHVGGWENVTAHISATRTGITAENLFTDCVLKTAFSQVVKLDCHSEYPAKELTFN